MQLLGCTYCTTTAYSLDSLLHKTLYILPITIDLMIKVMQELLPRIRKRRKCHFLERGGTYLTMLTLAGVE